MRNLKIELARFFGWTGVALASLALAGACGGDKDKETFFAYPTGGSAGSSGTGGAGGLASGGSPTGGSAGSGGSGGSGEGGEAGTPPAHCGSDGVCADASKRCDPGSDLCVECLFDSDCAGGRCLNRVCVATVTCVDSLDCVGASEDRTTCDPFLEECVQCSGPADCEPNHDCVDHRCRPYTPCADSRDCPSGQVCNPGTSRCVECVADGDCAGGERCASGECRLACASDKTCTPHGLLCNLTQGHCAECVDHRSCPDLYHCSEGKCVLDICEVGTSRCGSDTAIELCREPGSLYTSTPCGLTQTCVQGGKSASCSDWMCNPSTTACDANNRQLITCSDDGLSVIDSVDCAGQGQLCVDGQCRSLVCVPAALFCEGSSVRLCSADGLSSSLWTACGSGQYCDPVDTACKVGICAPNQPVCNGQVATTCNANGSGYTGASVDCSLQPQKICVSGACLCAPNQADCDGVGGNGCEVNVTTNVNHCGTCDAPCSSNHITPSCNGTCNGTCASGYADCNADKRTDGCETAIQSDVNNCGGCGLSCSENNVTRSCSSGVCNGACAVNHADCNGNKLSDGCEINTSSNVDHCGGCGLACSGANISRSCSGGSCNGTCAAGFADCNGDKRVDGCEINTLTNPNHCGGCNMPCPEGQSCSNGMCTALYTFSGVATNVPISSLAGWTQCHISTYGSTVNTLSTILATCSQANLLLGCRTTGSPTLLAAAHAPRADVIFDTGSDTTTVHNANGVNWYFNTSRSWGFVQQGDTVNKNSCDTGTLNPEFRLCWHTSGNNMTGGYRCGVTTSLNSSTAYERLIFQAP